MEDCRLLNSRIVTELAFIDFDGVRFFTVTIHTIYIEFTLLQVFEFSLKPELAFGSSTTEQGENCECIEK